MADAGVCAWVSCELTVRWIGGVERGRRRKGRGRGVRNVQIYKDLSCAGLGNVEFLDFGGDGAWFVVDDGFVLFGDVGRSHDDCWG